MQPHDKRQSIDTDQDYVCIQIRRHAAKLVAGFDHKYHKVINETYYMMPATSLIARDAVLVDNKLSA